VEPGNARTQLPATQDGDTGFHKGRNAKGHDMSNNARSQEGTCKEGKVFTAEQLPAGYEPIGHLDKENKALHSFLIRECNANRVNRFRIDGGKGYGRLYLHKDDIARLEEQFCRRHEVSSGDAIASPAATNLQYESVCESLADIAQSLAAVERLLERLATAAESIVTQPKTLQHDLLHTINGNPAPWNET
jgi:hypothetical protein